MLDAPLALWYPVLPSVAGVHNLFINLRFGRPPARWFSQVDPGNLTFLHRLSIWGIRWGGQAAGLFVPRPEFADLNHADRVLDWMISVSEPGRRIAVRTFVSSAVRLAERAQERGLDLSGVVSSSVGSPSLKRVVGSSKQRVGGRSPVMSPPSRASWPLAAPNGPRATTCIFTPIEWR